MTAPFRPARAPGHVRVVAVAGRADQALLDAGVRGLEVHGWRVSGDVRVDGGHPYLAADDAQRAESLVEAFFDPGVDTVICARGGYGSLRLLERVDFRALAETRKAFVGFSDVTALHLALNAAGLTTVHGPVVTLLGKLDEGLRQTAIERLEALLGGEVPARLEAKLVVDGSARGPLVGGNLSLLAACLPVRRFCPLPEGCILLIEEVNEPLYRIDRMLMGLLLAGLLEGVAGVALGSFAGCGEGESGPRRAEEVAVSVLERLGVPIAAGLPIGHGDADVPVLLGATAVLDSNGLSW